MSNPHDTATFNWSKGQKEFLRWVEFIFYTFLGFVGFSSFRSTDGPNMIAHTGMAGVFMIIGSVVGIFFLVKLPTVFEYQASIFIVSVGILFRPMGAVLNWFYTHEMDFVTVTNYSFVWIALWLMFVLKSLYIGMPYIEQRNKQRNFNKNKEKSIVIVMAPPSESTKQTVV